VGHPALPGRASVAAVLSAVFIMLVVAMPGRVGCASSGEKPFVVNSAPTPEGWPSPTPVGEIEIKEYPAYRAAVVQEEPALSPAPGAPSRRGDPSSSMFMTLFRHIEAEEIPMTAPVEMGYEMGTPEGSRLVRMAFLYQSTAVGEVGREGRVEVLDVPAQKVASIGVRGDYSRERFDAALRQLTEWIESAGGEWEISGPPRTFGYNGPFTPGPLRYGEVQVPVRPRPAPTPTPTPGTGR